MMRNDEKITSVLASVDPCSCLVRDLRQAIDGGRLHFGDKIATIPELQKKYNTSSKTIRRALAHVEQLGLVKRRQGAGTFIALDISRQRAAQLGQTSKAATATNTNVVAVMFRPGDDLFDHLCNALTNNLGEHGIGMLRPGVDWQNGSLNEKALLERWRESPPLAIVGQFDRPKLVEALHEAFGSQVLLINTMLVSLLPQCCHRVMPDYLASYRLIVDHLVEQGHRKIGFVTYRRHIQQQYPGTYRKRTTGHTQAILTAGHALRERGDGHQLAIHYNQSVEGQHDNGAFTQANIEHAAHWLCTQRPTAVFGDDCRIAGIIHAARQLGMDIPNDLCVVGLGNTVWSKALGFSSIDYNVDCIAKEIVGIIQRGAKDIGDTQHQITVSPQLIVRNIT